MSMQNFIELRTGFHNLMDGDMIYMTLQTLLNSTTSSTFENSISEIVRTMGSMDYI